MLRDKFNEALKEGLRSRNENLTGTVRLIIAEMKKRDIEARPKGNMDGISDDEILSMMQGMIKQRR
ncbi:MAG: GatB/YqeY domain-containing protein, partial [Alphaproteobacteria bacterium]|nr:GatB/YqeY domain-containing protein [Alphaproteobacteria bacterium]